MGFHDPLDNSRDLIDSREVEDRIETLTDEAAVNWGEQHPDRAEFEDPRDLAAFDPCEYLDDDEADELRALRDLKHDAEGYAPDWSYGETLIRDSYFEDYARQLAEDIGAIDPDAGWPMGYIDWEAAAEALLIDYTSVEFAGVTYWVR